MAAASAVLDWSPLGTKVRAATGAGPSAGVAPSLTAPSLTLATNLAVVQR